MNGTYFMIFIKIFFNYLLEKNEAYSQLMVKKYLNKFYKISFNYKYK